MSQKKQAKERERERERDDPSLVSTSGLLLLPLATRLDRRETACEGERARLPASAREQASQRHQDTGVQDGSLGQERLDKVTD